MSEQKILKKTMSAVVDIEVPTGFTSYTLVDKLETPKLEDYKKVVNQCRFFYRVDPIANTVINKIVEIGITDLDIDTTNLSQNEIKIYSAYKSKIEKFLESCALEYLITGLVVPEISFEDVGRDEIVRLGVKKYNKLYLPTSMWIRNSEHIKINSSFIKSDSPSYYLTIPQELITFVKSGGVYLDGNIDKERLSWLEVNFPEFISAIKQGKTEILLNNSLIIRRKYLADSPYPIPYLYPALDALKHKRNLRRMDYALAARVITAIQHIKVGSDNFPLLEGEETIFEEIRNQLRYKNTGEKDIERIIQLYTNHTVDISWIIPDVQTLLNQEKYIEVNDDIFFALGFPRILTTGETQRTQTSNHELATKSPIKTMESMQKDLQIIVDYITWQIAKLNGLTNVPKIKFGRIDFYRFAEFIDGLFKLRDAGGVSLETLASVFGLDYFEEKKQIERETSQ